MSKSLGNALYGDREGPNLDFAMGSVRGYRNWHVASDGTLMG